MAFGRSESASERNLLAQVIAHSEGLRVLDLRSLGFLIPFRYLRAKEAALQIRQALLGLPGLLAGKVKVRAKLRLVIVLWGAVWMITSSGLHAYQLVSIRVDKARQTGVKR